MHRIQLSESGGRVGSALGDGLSLKKFQELKRTIEAFSGVTR